MIVESKYSLNEIFRSKYSLLINKIDNAQEAKFAKVINIKILSKSDMFIENKITIDKIWKDTAINSKIFP